MHIFCGYFQFYKIINEYFNQKAQVFISNLSNHLKDQFSNIITKEKIIMKILKILLMIFLTVVMEIIYKAKMMKK